MFQHSVVFRRQEKRREERDIRRAARGLNKLDYSRRRMKKETSSREDVVMSLDQHVSNDSRPCRERRVSKELNQNRNRSDSRNLSHDQDLDERKSRRSQHIHRYTRDEDYRIKEKRVLDKNHR